MKIRIESSASTGKKKTGVGYYTRRLTDNLKLVPGIEVQEAQFNFRNRQLPKNTSIESINFPQKIYAKLDYLGVAPPFDLTLPSTDVTIFPNYALWPTVHSKRQIVTVHDLSFLKFPEVVEAKNLKYLKKIVPRSVTKADLVLTVSETVKQEIVEYYNVPANKIHVTPIPPTEIYSQPSDRPIHTTFKIPTKGYILFASTIEPRKNLTVLLDAYTQLPDHLRKDYSLVVAGGMGWKSDNIQAKLDNLKPHHPNIVLTGYYNQLDAAALYQQASVYVMPSLYEGFGMPLLEAMAGKTPTIASDIPVLREVGGGASLYFDPHDPEMLAQHLESVLTNETIASELIALGERNLERYSWTDVTRNLVRKIEEII